MCFKVSLGSGGFLDPKETVHHLEGATRTMVSCRRTALPFEMENIAFPAIDFSACSDLGGACFPSRSLGHRIGASNYSFNKKCRGGCEIALDSYHLRAFHRS